MTHDDARGLSNNATLIVDGYDGDGRIFSFERPVPATFVRTDGDGVYVHIPKKGWTITHVPFEMAHLPAA